ncbi:glycosyltransferase [Thermus thermophilus]|uniref:glycosyltransferase n=1 Tax=Thermus thermophilus TaxID=274 RepID=UPI00324ED206
MKRVLVFRDRLLPVSETFVANQSLGLKEYEAYFLGSRRASPSIDIPQERIALINPSNAKSLRSPDFRAEIQFKIFGKLPRRIVNWVQYLNPSLIHAHFAPDGALALPLAEVLKAPLIVSLLGTDITMNELAIFLKSWPSHRLYLLRKKQLQRKANLFIVPSKFLLQKALDRGYPAHKLVLLPHGVDTGFFYPSPERVEYGRILYVGRLVQLKGLPFLVEALAPLVSEFPELKLVVIGDGPKRKEYEEFSKKLLGDRVTFLGAQSKEVVRQEMQKAYLFSMPSITMPDGEAEAFGMVYLEAQACGVPVVAFASGGVPEVVLNGETGFLSPERDVASLRESIRSLLRSEELRHRLAKAAMRHAQEHFALSKLNEKLEDLYDGMLEGRVG